MHEQMSSVLPDMFALEFVRHWADIVPALGLTKRMPIYNVKYHRQSEVDSSTRKTA